MPARRPPAWLIPNLLSLDAPLVAVAWLFIFAKTWRVDYHPWPPYLALALVVWALYVADRLLDNTVRSQEIAHSLRHQTHQRFRRILVHGTWIAALLALLIAVFWLPSEIFFYGAAAGTIVVAFFAISLFVGSRSEIPYAKNLAAGLAFGFGTAMGAHAYLPAESVSTLFWSPEMLSFSLLCMLNITAIDLWEHSRRSADPEVKASDELSLTLPLALLAAFALLFALRSHQADPAAPNYTRPFYISIMVSSAALQVVNRVRHRFSLDSLRVLADICLLLPWVYFLIA